MMDANIFNVLQARGYIYQCTHMERMKELLESGSPVTFYLGIDPTAESLHIGHFFALMMFRYLQDAGHKGILVIGGATALVGDPSGKSDMRKVLTEEEVRHNLAEVRELAKRFIRMDGENPAIIVNNADWMDSYTYVDFMRLVGLHFNVNTMLAADAYANRLQSGGLTFLEMGYMLMQAFDFVHLSEEYNCVLQIGGSDQWGNIVAGTSLRRKMNFLKFGEEKDADELIGLTCPLLLTKDGKKMGKTESGTLWVAREKTTAYDFYQYFYNVDDADVEMLLKLFTHIGLEEIDEVCAGDIVQAKRLMAYEVTKLVHGSQEVEQVNLAVKALFREETSGEHAPLSDYCAEGEAINVVDLFVQAGFVESKGEIRRLIQQNGASVDGRKCGSPEDMIQKPGDKDYVLLKKGKKHFMKVNWGSGSVGPQ